jgi:putative adhesin
MNRNRQHATWLGAVLGTVCSLFLLALGAHASDHRGALTEEFHQTYAITADGRIELDNINGAVHISSWDRNEVKVDAVKYADTKERLDEAKIEIDSGKDYLSIRTKYPSHDNTWNWGSHNNPAGVEYTLTVPRGVRLDEIKLINGSLDISGVTGEVRASCINGRLEAHDLAGRAELSTINGRLEAKFDQLAGQSVELNSVNGSVDLTIPSDSNAEVEASTVSGGINNDFGLHVNNHRFVGHDLRGELGNGGTHIKLSNVNGRVEIHHAQDGHAMSPVKDRGERDKDNDDDSEL